MSDTLGGLVDKLGIVNLKMWNNQELLYDLRRMSFDEFMLKYFNDQNQAKELFECLKKCCDLNVQRNDLIDELDELFRNTLVSVAKDLSPDRFKNDVSREYEDKRIESMIDDLGLTQKKHKSYSKDADEACSIESGAGNMPSDERDQAQ